MDNRSRRQLLWEAHDGAKRSAGALLKLVTEFKHEGSSEALDQAHDLWEACIKLSNAHTRRPYDGCAD